MNCRASCQGSPISTAQRVLRASKANVKNVKEPDEALNKVAAQFDTMVGQGEVRKDNIPVDVVAGTPIKLMEMARCQG